MHTATTSDALARADGETRRLERPDGRTVSYARYGAVDGRPTLFLHGTPGSRLLGEILDEPARRAGVSVLSPDRPGYGQSTPADPTPATVAADCLAVLDDVGADSARVVGFSGGGRHALTLAAAHPDRVERVDLVSTAVPPGMREETPAPLKLLGTLAERTPRLLSGLFRGQAWASERLGPSVVASQYTTDGAAPVSDEIVDLAAEDFREAVAESRRGVIAESRAFGDPWTVSPESVEVPVELFHGAHDQNAPLSGARRLTEQLPDARLTVFEDADHLGVLERAASELFDQG